MPRPSEWFNRPSNAWTWPMVTLVFLIVIVLVGVVLSLTFVGCAAQPGGQGTSGQSGPSTVRQGSSGDITQHTVTLSDGRVVTCLTWSTHDYMTEATSSGMDCLEPEAE